MSMREDDDDAPVVLRVCECGAIARAESGWLTRCGRDGRHNMSASCPAPTFRVVAWEPVEPASS